METFNLIRVLISLPKKKHKHAHSENTKFFRSLTLCCCSVEGFACENSKRFLHRSSNYVRLMWNEANNNNQQHQIIKTERTTNERVTSELRTQKKHEKCNQIELIKKNLFVVGIRYQYKTFPIIFQLMFFFLESAIELIIERSGMHRKVFTLCLLMWTIFISWNSIFVFWFYYFFHFSWVHFAK